MHRMETCSCIIAAGGSGSRMNSDVPKQFLAIGGCCILEHTLLALSASPHIAEIVVASPKDYTSLTESISQKFAKVSAIFQGGATRQQTIQLGLRLISRDIVLVHDGARPFVSQEMIRDVFLSAQAHQAAIPVVPVRDTIKIRSESVSTPPRDQCFVAQTPQGFSTALLRTAHEHARLNGLTVTDDASCVEHLGIDPYFVSGSEGNIKITTQQDLSYASFLFQNLK